MIDQHTGIWLTNDHKHWFDESLANALCKFFKKKNGTVADFGCGDGRYLKKFKQEEIECTGFDGNPDTESLTGGVASVLDLSVPVNLPCFDWVLSLEVGEHIPANRENVFIRNLCKHCRKGIIISWAVPGQGGEGHFNEKSNAYVKTLFSSLNFENDLRTENAFRKISTLKWFRDTLMVFVR